MGGSWRLGFVAAMVWVSTGCLELDSSLDVRGDGSGAFSTRLKIGESLTRMMDKLGSMSNEFGSLLSEGMPHKLSGKVRKQLAAEGYRDVAVSVSRSKKAIGWEMSGGFPSVTTLGALGEHIGGAVPTANLYAMGDGTYVLAWVPGKDSGQKKPETPEMDEKQAMELMKSLGDIGTIMAEMATFRMALSADVPGEVLSVDPDWGTVEGRKVSWVISAAEIMALAGQGDAGKGAFPEAFRVRFRPDAPMPPEVLSEGGTLDMGELI